MSPASVAAGTGPRAQIDREGNVSRWDPAFETLWGRSAAQALGRKLRELLVPLEPAALPDLGSVRDAGAWSGVVALVPTNGNAPRTTGIRLSRPGPSTPAPEALELELAPLSVLAAEPPSSDAPLEPVRDLQRFAALLEHMPGFCYTVNRELVFTSSAGKGLGLLGLKPGQVIGLHLRDLWATRDDTYEPLVCHLKALAGISSRYKDVCLGRSIEYLIRPLRDESGGVVGAIGVAVDVTETESLRQEQGKVAAQLRQAQKMEVLGRLAGGVAHDFNNFLTCIMGNLSLLEAHLQRRGAEPGARVRDLEAEAFLAQANAAADSAAQLTRQLLAFSRKQVISPRPLSVSALVERLCKILKRLVGDRISLRAECEPELWSVHADPGLLEQVLVNLVINARDAIAEAGQIVIETRNLDLSGPGAELPESLLPGSLLPGGLLPGKYVALSVRDSGRGLSDHERARLFEPFFTTKEAGEGTGLGLATVYSAVQQSGGGIRVESELGKGSTFCILLPKLDALAAPELAPSALVGGPATVPGGTETVLLVEHEPLVLELAQRTLQQLGYNVLPCASPDEALRTFGEYQSRIQLLVADLSLPRMTGTDMSGAELAARLRALSPGVPVLFSSGYGDAPSAKHRACGEDGTLLISKPYRPRELAAKVRQLLDQRS